MSIASSSLFFYDYLLTLHSEILYTWRTHLSIGTSFYFLTRYSAFIAAILVLLPTNVVTANILSCLRFIAILSAELIFALRAWAIWERGRTVLAIVICVTIAGVVPAVVIIVKDLSSSAADPNVPPGFPQCSTLVSAVGRLWIVPYIVIILYEFVVLTLTLIKLAQLRSRIAPHSRSSVLTTLRLDGIFYFIFMMALGALNIALVVQVSSPQLRQGGTQIQTVFHSMLSTRIVFHVMTTTSKDISRAGSSLQPVLSTQIALDDLPRHRNPERGEDHQD